MRMDFKEARILTLEFRRCAIKLMGLYCTRDPADQTTWVVTGKTIAGGDEGEQLYFSSLEQYYAWLRGDDNEGVRRAKGTGVFVPVAERRQYRGPAAEFTV